MIEISRVPKSDSEIDYHRLTTISPNFVFKRHKSMPAFEKLNTEQGYDLKMKINRQPRLFRNPKVYPYVDDMNLIKSPNTATVTVGENSSHSHSSRSNKYSDDLVLEDLENICSSESAKDSDYEDKVSTKTFDRFQNKYYSFDDTRYLEESNLISRIVDNRSSENDASNVFHFQKKSNVVLDYTGIIHIDYLESGVIRIESDHSILRGLYVVTSVYSLPSKSSPLSTSNSSKESKKSQKFVEKLSERNFYYLGDNNFTDMNHIISETIGTPRPHTPTMFKYSPVIEEISEKSENESLRSFISLRNKQELEKKETSIRNAQTDVRKKQRPETRRKMCWTQSTENLHIKEKFVSRDISNSKEKVQQLSEKEKAIVLLKDTQILVKKNDSKEAINIENLDLFSQKEVHDQKNKLVNSIHIMKKYFCCIDLQMKEVIKKNPTEKSYSFYSCFDWLKKCFCQKKEKKLINRNIETIMNHVDLKKLQTGLKRSYSF